MPSDSLTPPQRPGGSSRIRTISTASIRGLRSLGSRSASSTSLKAKAQAQTEAGDTPPVPSLPTGRTTPSGLTGDSNTLDGQRRASANTSSGRPSTDSGGVVAPAPDSSGSHTLSNPPTPIPSLSQAPTIAPTQPRPGHPGNLSVSQAAALKTFEQELRRLNALPKGYEAGATDEEVSWAQVTLTRYLRARSWNVNNALTMYRATQKWRVSQELNALVDPSSSSYFTFEERDAVAEAGWSMYFHNVDKLGRPIFVQGLAGLDTVKLLKATTAERIQTNFCCTLEKACQTRYRAATQARRSLGDSTALIDDNFMIVDIGGLGMSTFWAFKGQLQGLLATLDANFPELSGRVQIINAPWLFSSIWAYIKGWLPVGTVDKIDIQGADYKSTLLQYIDADQLPAFYGGTCQCSEGCTKSDVGPWHKLPTTNTTGKDPAEPEAPGVVSANGSTGSSAVEKSSDSNGETSASPMPNIAIDGSGALMNAIEPQGGLKSAAAPVTAPIDAGAQVTSPSNK